MTTQISRDPFARETLVREVAEGIGDCDWCGGNRISRRTGNALRAFRYGTERDDRGGVSWHHGQFCSKGCHDSYHG